MQAAKPACAIKALQKGILRYPRYSREPAWMVSLGIAYGRLGDTSKKRDCLERALQIEEAQYGPDHPEVAITLVNLGNAYGDLGDTSKK
eukprot:2644220-Amphidinium_carterae.1